MDDKPGTPVPLPRNQHTPKAPVPLPRTKTPINLYDTPHEPSQETPEKSTSSATDTLKKSLRKVTNNVQERGVAVLEGTKNVGTLIENSVKNILSKRNSFGASKSYSGNEDKPIEEDDRCISLPADDIFQSISFGSPLATPAEDEELPEEFYLKNFPPPPYPPPPLPDVSLYDEIPSSHSSTSDPYLSVPSVPENPIELNNEVENINRMSALYLGTSSTSDNSSVTGKSDVTAGDLPRSKSWNFYDAVEISSDGCDGKPEYENVKIVPSFGKPRATKYGDNVLFNSSKSSDGSSQSSKVAVNEMYENWSVSEVDAAPNDFSVRSVPSFQHSKSVILEFDPLFGDDPALADDIGGELATNDSGAGSSSGKSMCNDIPLPVPPERSDSLLEDNARALRTPPPPPPPEKPEACVFVDDSEYVYLTEGGAPGEGPEKEIPGRKKVSVGRWSSMKRAFKMVADGTPWVPGWKNNQKKEEELTAVGSVFEKPYLLSTVQTCQHSGQIFKSPSNGDKPKDFVTKWCALSEGKISLSPEKSSSSKEYIPLESVLSVQLGSEQKLSFDGDDIFCWEVSVTGRSRPYLFGNSSSPDRRQWMRKLLESLMSVFPSKMAVDYTRVGWCFLKEGISGFWTTAWVLLSKRTLHYCLYGGKPKGLDLRKGRHIVLQSGGDSPPNVTEQGPYLVVHTVDEVLYMQMDVVRESKAWRQVILNAAIDSGPALEDQQLTKYDIPVIVEKCINFIYAHGSMSEGIYRRSGIVSSVSQLFSLLRKNAWTVQLSRQDFTEHDVASVLKRFFRELPDPLFTSLLHKYFCNVTTSKCSKSDRVLIYRTLLEKLPRINYLTAKKLMGHLYFIHEQADKNRMPAENLAAIWAPTIMHIEGKDGKEWSQKEREVLCDLILNYKSVFLVDCDEVDREKRMLEVLERVTATPNIVQRPSGDLKLSIYIGSKHGDCATIVVNPTKEAGEVCLELCGKTEYAAHELCLTEIVLSGSLSRPLHHSERVLDTAIRWAYWDNSDCKDNYLVLVPNIVFRELVPLAKPPLSKCGELKFADQKTRSFKNFMFEFSQAKLSYYKDKSCTMKIQEWRIEEMVWYIGHEPKRNPQTRWAITFINRNSKVKRCKEAPYFGWTIGGSSKEDQQQWMAAMLIGEYPHTELLPRSQR